MGTSSVNVGVQISVLSGTTHYGTPGEDLIVPSDQEFDKAARFYANLWESHKMVAADGGFVTYKVEHSTFNGYDAITITGSRTASVALNKSAVFRSIWILHDNRIYWLDSSDLYQNGRIIANPNLGAQLQSFRFTDS